MVICDEYVIENHNPYLVKSEPKINNETKYEGWIQDNSNKINQVTTLMIKTRDHQHWRVRLQLVISCEVLLNKCTR